jgi:hypothetical protein
LKYILIIHVACKQAIIRVKPSNFRYFRYSELTKLTLVILDSFISRYSMVIFTGLLHRAGDLVKDGKMVRVHT